MVNDGMKITMSIASRPMENGKYEAIIIIGEFDTEQGALLMATTGGHKITAALHAAKLALQNNQQNGECNGKV